jgi:hypothetical protein
MWLTYLLHIGYICGRQTEQANAGADGGFITNVRNLIGDEYSHYPLIYEIIITWSFY